MGPLKIWRVEEASERLPELRLLIREQTERALMVEFLHRRWTRSARRDQAVRSLERDIQRQLAALEAARRALFDLGARCRDPRSGECELFGEVEGRPVMLRVRHDDETLRVETLASTPA